MTGYLDLPLRSMEHASQEVALSRAMFATYRGVPVALWPSGPNEYSGFTIGLAPIVVPKRMFQRGKSAIEPADYQRLQELLRAKGIDLQRVERLRT
jgi:hypothetical protein